VTAYTLDPIDVALNDFLPGVATTIALTETREQMKLFDRLVIDKKIESREAYFKNLQKLVETTRSNDAIATEAWTDAQKARDERARTTAMIRVKKRGFGSSAAGAGTAPAAGAADGAGAAAASAAGTGTPGFSTP
jgi:hypothetical protein